MSIADVDTSETVPNFKVNSSSACLQAEPGGGRFFCEFSKTTAVTSSQNDVVVHLCVYTVHVAAFRFLF